MQKSLQGAKIISKNKDYGSVQEAQMFYEKERMKILSEILFPKEEFPEGFKENLIYLMRFQNPVQMNVWHNKNVSIKNDLGEKISTTWENMCNWSRPFVIAEVYQCIEILKRCTPLEVWCGESKFNEKFPQLIELIEDSKILHFFNEVFYPDIEVCVGSVQKVMDEIEEQLCAPIRAKINADLKIMMQLPVGQNIEFIKGKQRKM